jgi:hypothetical protein
MGPLSFEDVPGERELQAGALRQASARPAPTAVARWCLLSSIEGLLPPRASYWLSQFCVQAALHFILSQSPQAVVRL